MLTQQLPDRLMIFCYINGFAVRHVKGISLKLAVEFLTKDNNLEL